MRQSVLFNKVSHNVDTTEPSKNAQLLNRAGYIYKLMSGAYSYTPLGLKVLNNIENLIRQYMDSLGAQEVLMPVLQPKEIWDKTGRWNKIDVMYKIKGAKDRDLALSPTNEEVATPFVTDFVKSYRDLPLAIYQIQSKFRNEPRAKSGLFRGREFRMKDLYSFHTSQEDLDKFYEQVIVAYFDFYKKCGLGNRTFYTYASGGAFAKYSHEFQTLTDAGEDTIYLLPDTNIAINREIITDKTALRDIIPNYKDGMENELEVKRAVEVGNIFKLGTRFTSAFGGTFSDVDGKQKPIIMGCYGIGPSRVMGTIAECLSDNRGLVWPEEIAPYKVHLVPVFHTEEELQKCDKVYEKLMDAGIDVLYDDRRDLRGGSKFITSDLLGIPNRLILGKQFLETGNVEWKKRTEKEPTILPLGAFIQKFATRTPIMKRVTMQQVINQSRQH